MTTGLYMLRALQSGLRIAELQDLEYGMVLDIITEAGNDSCEYDQLATAEDMRRF